MAEARLSTNAIRPIAIAIVGLLKRLRTTPSRHAPPQWRHRRAALIPTCDGVHPRRPARKRVGLYHGGRQRTTRPMTLTVVKNNAAVLLASGGIHYDLNRIAPNVSCRRLLRQDQGRSFGHAQAPSPPQTTTKAASGGQRQRRAEACPAAEVIHSEPWPATRRAAWRRRRTSRAGRVGRAGAEHFHRHVGAVAVHRGAGVGMDDTVRRALSQPVPSARRRLPNRDENAAACARPAGRSQWLMRSRYSGACTGGTGPISATFSAPWRLPSRPARGRRG